MPTPISKNSQNPPRYAHLKRLPNWQIRLNRFIVESVEQGQKLALDWHDITCCSWTAQWVEAITGVNPYVGAGYEGKHSTPAEAAKLILRDGYNTFDEVLESFFTEVPPIMAHRGDICLVGVRDIPEDIPYDRVVIPHAVGGVDDYFFWVVNPEGLARGKKDQILRSFIIGER